MNLDKIFSTFCDLQFDDGAIFSISEQFLREVFVFFNSVAQVYVYKVLAEILIGNEHNAILFGNKHFFGLGQ